MKSPLVHDHDWLGWVLFAIMLLVLFQIGRRMADRDDPAQRGASATLREPSTRPAAPARAFWATAVAVVAIGATWTALARGFDRPLPGEVRYAGPESDPAWEELAYQPWEWKPWYQGPSTEFVRSYEQGGEVVGLYVGYYRNQRPGAELIQTGNGFLEPGTRVWKRSALAERSVPVQGRTIPVTQADLEAPGVRLRVWRMYWAGGRFVASESEVKVQQLRSKLSGKGDDAAVLMLSTGHEPGADEATARLTRFLSARLGPLERSLWYTSGRGPAKPPAG